MSPCGFVLDEPRLIQNNSDLARAVDDKQTVNQQVDCISAPTFHDMLSPRPLEHLSSIGRGAVAAIEDLDRSLSIVRDESSVTREQSQLDAFSETYDLHDRCRVHNQTWLRELRDETASTITGR